MNPETLELLKSRANIYHHGAIPSLAIKVNNPYYLGRDITPAFMKEPPYRTSPLHSWLGYTLYDCDGTQVLIYNDEIELGYIEGEDDHACHHFNKKPSGTYITLEETYILFPIDIPAYEALFRE